MTMTKFSATFNRLSQYLKEQQRLAAARPTTTMNLLPPLEVLETTVDISDQQPMDLFPHKAGLDLAPLKEKKAQLTIFYGGQILVFDNFPAERANDLMLMAKKGYYDDPPAAPSAVGEAAALPFCRRASLHRFIEKRRERIHSSTAPYQKDASRAKSTVLPGFFVARRLQSRNKRLRVS